MRKVSSPDICSPLNTSVYGQRRPRSDCADAQSDLGLRCPHIPEDTFWHDVAHFTVTCSFLSLKLLKETNKHFYALPLKTVEYVGG